MIFCFSESRMAQQTSRWKFWQGRPVHITWGGHTVRHRWTHGPHHLRRTPIRSRSRSNTEKKTHLPESEDVLEAELPLESDQQPAETEVQISWILRLWEANGKWELKPSWLRFLFKGRFVTGRNESKLRVFKVQLTTLWRSSGDTKHVKVSTFKPYQSFTPPVPGGTARHMNHFLCRTTFSLWGRLNVLWISEMIQINSHLFLHFSLLVWFLFYFPARLTFRTKYFYCEALCNFCFESTI